jgi:hypothetical protein
MRERKEPGSLCVEVSREVTQSIRRLVEFGCDWTFCDLWTLYEPVKQFNFVLDNKVSSPVVENTTWGTRLPTINMHNVY